MPSEQRLMATDAAGLIVRTSTPCSPEGSPGGFAREPKPILASLHTADDREILIASGSDLAVTSR
jgi:hypothetical protein